MHVTQHVILSYLDQRKYRHTTMVRHQGQVIVLGMDDAGLIKYTVLDLQGDSDAHELLAVHAHLEQMDPLNFPTAFVRVRDGAGKVTRLPVVTNDPFLSSTARFTADAAFQALSDDNDIFLFRQSRTGDHADMADNTLLLDRYEVAGTRLQLKTSDGSPEPTCVLDFVRHLHAGRFTALLLPTADTTTRRWQIFAYNGQTQHIDAFNVKRSADGRFDTQVPPEDSSPGTAASAAEVQTAGATNDREASTPVGGQRIAGSALQLDMGNDRVDFGTIDFARNNYTVEMWVKSTTSGQADLLTATIPGNTAQRMLIGFGEDGKLRYVPRQGRNDAGITSPEPCNDGSWHHVAAVKDGLTATLDVDGISVGVTPVENIFSTGLHLLLGEEKIVRDTGSGLSVPAGGQTRESAIAIAQSGTVRTIRVSTDIAHPIGYNPASMGARGKVDIDEVCIWNRARSHDEIQSTMSQRLRGNEDGLAGYWCFDEGQGNTVRDQIGANGHPGTIHGGTWVDSDAPIEIPEAQYSLQFDGVGDYIDLRNPAPLQITGSQTIEMWVKPARYPVREGGLYCKASSGEGSMLIKGDGRLRYGYGQNPSDLFGSSGSYQFIDSTKSLQVKQWSHVAIVRNLEAPERKLSWYINGVLDSEVGAQFATARAGNLPVQIGRQSGRSFYFPGQIDEVRVWNRARSADEIKADMHHQLEGNEPGLVGYWRIDEGEGTIVHDRTANANHGTIYGAKWAPSAPVEKRPTYLEAESALQFASDDMYVDCGAGIDLRGTDFTIELWAKRTAPDAGQQFAIGHGDSKERQHVLHIGFRANNQFTFAFGDDDAVSTQRRFRDTNWHHWACVYTHAERRRVMYYDGEQLNPKNNTAKAPYQGTGQFVIGKAPWGDGWRGDIDEVRVWRCARSPDDIQHDRSHRLVGDEPDLVAYWRFDEGAGNTTRNQVANAHHGTLHGNTNNAMWVTSSAPVRDHPSLDRSSFALAGRTIASGLSALLYAPQRGSQTDATPDIARVLLAVATGGANTAGQPTDPQSIALVDFAVSPYGKLGPVPDTLALPAVTANAAVISDLQRNAQREAELQGSIIQGFVPQDPPLAASNTQRHAYFGSAVAISGDWAIVGAHEASPDGVAHAGSAEVFRLKDDKWVYHQTLMASDKQANAHFGVAVAISGQWALIGAYEASLPGFDYAGNVEVFRLKDDKWVYDEPLMASDKQANAHFGVAVALDETWAIVGADTANAGGVAGAGKAYLFELVNDTWADRGPIEASDRQENAGFGSAVALSGGWALVGAYGAGPDALTEAGSAYVFQLTSKGWEVKEPPLVASNKQARAYFGSAVALHDSWALVGADREDVAGAEHAGRVYVFRFNGEEWEERSPPLAPSSIQAHAHFGRAVGLSERWAIVGAQQLTPQTTDWVGSAYVFQRLNGTWVPTPPLAPDTPQTHASFSSGVALHMDRVVISAPRQDVDGTTQAGRTYIYDSFLTAYLAELDRVQADIESLQKDVGNAAQPLPLVHRAPSGLTVYGGVVGVATAEGTPYLVDGATGAHLWPALLIRRIDR